MVYLESFQPNMEIRHIYPYNVMSSKRLEHIEFAPITIFYGNNGSGKSTFLNVIAECVGIAHKTLGNSNEYFRSYVNKCTFQLNRHLPENSTFIRSEDIMEGIVSGRKKYVRMSQEAQCSFNTLMPDDNEFGREQQIRFIKALNDPDALTPTDRFLLSNTKYYNDALSAKRALPEFQSNGETALRYFEKVLDADTLYLLDEPENSMAPAYQQELANRIEWMAYRLNTQFIIATHSPFLLSMHGARIYDLDVLPAQIREWYELENMQTYYRLFKCFENLFHL